MRARPAVILALLAAFAVATQGSSGCASSSSSSSSSGSASGGESSGGSSHNDPSKNATESNTPSVGPTGSVEVDDLRWRLVHAERKSSIGDAESGLGATANGTFVVVTLHVDSHRKDTATLTDEVVSLRAAGKDYKPSTDAETALSGEGGKILLAQELGPEVSLTVRTAFDVPPQVLHEHPQLRFKELGFGPTKGYIALPPL